MEKIRDKSSDLDCDNCNKQVYLSKQLTNKGYNANFMVKIEHEKSFQSLINIFHFIDKNGVKKFHT